MAVPQYAKPFHAATGAPAPPEWAGYWTFVTAVIMVAFILFLAGKGTLSKWLGLFNLGAIKPLSLTGVTGAQTGQPVGTVNTPLGAVPGVTTLSPGASGIIVGPGGGEVMNPGPAFNPFQYLPKEPFTINGVEPFLGAGPGNSGVK